jgi:putative Mn2+ efflux pump MntP
LPTTFEALVSVSGLEFAAVRALAAADAPLRTTSRCVAGTEGLAVLGSRGLTAAATPKLIALVLPLGLDTLGVALALGVAGLPQQKRLRVSLLFAGFEAAMPLLGVALGAPLGHAIGSAADYIAAALITALGIYMLLAESDEEDRLLSLTRRGLFGALALGVSISLDELAIGFSAGLLRLPIPAMVIAIAAQAFIVTQIGVRIGARVGERMREATEQLAGLALVALGVILLITQLTT